VYSSRALCFIFGALNKYLNVYDETKAQYNIKHCSMLEDDEEKILDDDEALKEEIL
jgi:hypothetical protein